MGLTSVGLYFICLVLAGSARPSSATVSCYTCGLEVFDPEVDNPGSYSLTINGTKGLKMYNHSCDEMDRKKSQVVPIVITKDIIDPFMERAEDTIEIVEYFKTVNKDLEAGIQFYESEYLDEMQLVKKAQKPALPAWSKFESLVNDNYDMEMWQRKCDEGVVSCFIATGDYDFQLPTFRGCAATTYPHDVKCDKEQQAVTVVENSRSVDVAVDLCYCNSDLCNFAMNSARILNQSSIWLMLLITIAKLI